MYTLHVFSVILSLNVDTGLMNKVKRFDGDYVYHAGTDAFYKVYSVTRSWMDARKICANEKAVIASPINAATRSEMVNMATKNNIQNLTLYTGFSDILVPNFFMSDDGTSLYETDLNVLWASGAPRSNARQNCLVMFANGMIGDKSCEAMHPYICMAKHLKDDKVFDACGIDDPDYTWKSTGCYKLYLQPLTWKGAYFKCHGDAGHLAVINSPEEAKEVSELFTKLVPNITANVYKESFFIGFHMEYDHIGWVTLQGERLNVSGYEVWAENQPSNDPPGEYCGTMFTDGKLNDAPCDTNLTFMCERRKAAQTAPSARFMGPNERRNWREVIFDNED